jgi:hypothetical protein
MSSNNINKIVTYLKRALYTFQTLQSVLIPRRALEEFKECLKGANGLHKLLKSKISKSRNRDYIDPLGLLGYVAFLELLAGNALGRIRGKNLCKWSPLSDL